MRPVFLCFAVILLLLVSPLQAQEGPLQIVVSHSIAADVVSRVAGDDAEVVSLIPRGSDPHSFRPAPSDLRALVNADLVFINGANYEEGLLAVIDAAVEHEALFVISECVPMLPGGHAHEHDDHAHGDDEDEHADDHHDEADDDHADEEHHADEADDDHADEADDEDHADEADDEDHADEDHHADEADDDHADDDHADDEHADDEHADDDHADDAHAHDHAEPEIGADAAERCAQHEMELGERFVRLQDDEASPRAALRPGLRRHRRLRPARVAAAAQHRALDPDREGYPLDARQRSRRGLSRARRGVP